MYDLYAGKHQCKYIYDPNHMDSFCDGFDSLRKALSVTQRTCC